MSGGCASARRAATRLALAVCLAATCLPFWPGEARADRCRAEKAQFAVNRPYTDAAAEKARVAAGADKVRRLEPSRVYTMDFRPDRLNLRVNSRGIVTSVACG